MGYIFTSLIKREPKELEDHGKTLWPEMPVE